MDWELGQRILVLAEYLTDLNLVERPLIRQFA